MNCSNIALFGLLFLLTNNGTISLTQCLLLATLISTTTNLCGCNQTTI